MRIVSGIRGATGRFEVAREVLSFFWTKKRWWLVPMLVALFLFGALIILAQSSVISPFVYALF